MNEAVKIILSIIQLAAILYLGYVVIKGNAKTLKEMRKVLQGRLHSAETNDLLHICKTSKNKSLVKYAKIELIKRGIAL